MEHSTDIKYIKLSDLTKQVASVIEQQLSSLSFWIVADITNYSFKEKTNYHYFDLAEKAEDSNQLVAKIAGKAWGSGSSRIAEFKRVTGQQFGNNINVLVKVKVVYHVVFGLSLDVIDIDTSFTLGVLEQQRQATLARLVAENPEVIKKIGDKFHTRNASLNLPRVIQRIAVVSSKTSAGNEDFKHTLQNNPFNYLFYIDDYYTVVQNEANAQQFLDSLISVFKSGRIYDVVVINRGGGSQTDFLIFDNYKIGVAVARFPIPIITGIGHQKNETIVDLMAHTATKTPTKAAEFIVSHNRHFEDSIINFQKNILIKSQQIFSIQYQSLTNIKSSIFNNTRTYLSERKDQLVSSNQIITNKTKSFVFHQQSKLTLLASTIVTMPKILTANKMHDIKHIINNISAFKTSYLRNHRGYLGHYVSIINLMSPQNILKKGFAIIKQRGKVTSDPALFHKGSEMEVIFSGKVIETTVKSTKDYNGSEFNI